jgi:hypothetical protein
MYGSKSIVLGAVAASPDVAAKTRNDNSAKQITIPGSQQCDRRPETNDGLAAG